MHDGCLTKTDHNSSPSAFGSGELKRHLEVPEYVEMQHHMMGSLKLAMTSLVF